MKILITGARGQLGTQLCKMLQRGDSELGSIPEVYKAVDITAIDYQELDITKVANTLSFIEKLHPDVIINCAAYTNVDGCESNQDAAFAVNAIGSRNLAMAAEKVGARLIHVSTDYVFAGDGSVPYREFDQAKPVSVYGKTKLLGEEYIKTFCSRYFIVRTAWLYGYDGNNFVKTILKVAKEKGHLDVVDDQRGNPTNAEDLAFHLLKLALTEEYGIYHCTGNGECSWYDFASKIVEYASIPCTVTPIISSQLTRTAKRPSFSSLDHMMLRATVGDEMREWKVALKVFIDKIGV
jgi:dTDP-4-dehydrorhamnose reductase